MSTVVHFLSLFANSGHHTGFLALTWDSDLEGPAPESVRWKGTDASPVKNLMRRARTDEWRSLDDAPWIRTRVGKKLIRDGVIERQVYGVWVSVDTTMGEEDRGYTVCASEDSEEIEIRQDNRLPYAARDEMSLGEASRFTLNGALDLEGDFPELVVEVEWREPAGDAIPVDLVVDFGNTRTVVLAVERIADSQGFASVCRPIFFPGPEWDSGDLDYMQVDLSSAIPDSWFMLLEPVFKNNPVMKWTPKVEERPRSFFSFGMGRKKKEASHTYKAPHLFRELSPALIGSAARTRLSAVNVEQGGLSFLSSPKRYIWETEATGTEGSTVWTMHQQPWRSSQGSSRRLTPLNGELMRFMPRAGAIWHPEADPKDPDAKLDLEEEAANHARSEALTWVALAILERAHAQIQSERWREGNRPFLPRRLGDILLTYPAGWTESEVRAYESRWKGARDIFVASREAEAVEKLSSGVAPQVKLDLDEAVAPQLVLIYSEVHHMRDYGRNWISLYGRTDGERATVRVMTIDIGGGTTDTSILEYVDEQDGVGVDLRATLLFKDSHGIAGDRLVKDLIECVLLPALGAKFADDQSAREAFEQMFFAKALREAERAQWSVITRTVLIPIVHAWLSEFITAHEADRPAMIDPISPKDAGASPDQIAKLNKLAAAFGLKKPVIEFEAPIKVDPDVARNTIRAWFSDLANTFARYCAIFDCDLVMLTGKPSELPEVRTLLEYRLPLTPNRVLSMRGYYAGEWLPLTRDGCIPDAKLVTALGAAIYQGMTNGMITGWRVRGSLNEPFRVNNHWGRMAGDAKPFTAGDILLKPDDREVTVDVTSDTYIGRAAFLSHVRPDQIYHLRVTGRQSAGPPRRLRVTLRRMINDEARNSYSMSGESLELVSAVDAETGKKLAKDDIELRLCTLPRGEAYWQDTGRFEVRWDSGPDGAGSEATGEKR